MIDLPLEHQEFEDQLLQKIKQTLKEGFYINGKEVKTFGTSLSTYLNSPFVVPCGNGTDALQIALMSLELPKDAEILIPAFNYVSSAEAACLLGFTPVFVDADIKTYNCCITDLESKITSKSKVIMATHLFGQASNMTAIMELAKKHALFVIEDNAQALGCKVLQNNQWVFGGTIGDIGTTSFFPTKNLGGMGDGGAIFTSNEQLASKIKAIALHGQLEKYTYTSIGVNSRLDTLQAALLDVKLNYLEDRLEKRKAIASTYLNQLDKNKYTLPLLLENCTHTFNQFTIQTNQREEVVKVLKDKGIPCMVYYPLALHQQPAYAQYSKSKLPNAEKLCETVLSLPIHPVLTADEQAYIINTLNSIA